MNKQIKDYIKLLSKHDNKTLSQKFTKTIEEIGELGSKILPFEDASGTLHRFVERQEILEECVDTILCIQSIIEDMEFTDEDIEKMYQKKLAKWAGLQEQEDKISGKPIPFEIHVTIELKDTQSVNYFRQVCEEIQVKPIILDLQTQEGSVLRDVMTSSWHLGSNNSAYNETINIASKLKDRGFDVVRQKIETVPWHPASPKSNKESMPKDCYFESHLGVIITSDQEDDLRKICHSSGVHLSRNVYKKLDNNKFLIMCTLRSYTMYEAEFKDWVNEFKNQLLSLNFTVEREIVEFSIFDTRITHDAEWLKNN